MVDGLVASLVLTFLWSGWQTGSVYQLGQTVTIFMAALVARAITLPVARFFIDAQGSDDPDYAVGIAFIGCFIAIYALLWLSVVRLTEEMRNFHQRGPQDRFLGAAVGAVRGGLIGVVLAVGIMTLTFDRPNNAVDAAMERSQIGDIAIRYDFLLPFAHKLEEELDERANADPADDRAWDMPK